MKTKWMMAGTLSLTCLAAACGAGTDRDDAPGNKDDTSVDLTTDEESAGAVVTGQVDEAVSRAVEENDASSAAGLALADASVTGEANRYRQCTAEGDTAKVEIVHSLTRTKTLTGPRRKASSSFSAYHERTRTWSREGGKVACAANGLHADLDLADIEGVKVAVVFKHERSRSQSLENLKSGEKVERWMKFAANGTREVTWLDVATSDDEITISKEVTGTATRKLEFKKRDGTTKTIENSIANAEGQPLKVKVVRDATTNAFESRTIESGTLVATGKDGGRVETTFANVLYLADKGCHASSGTISGKVYAKDATEPAVTFTVAFDGEGGRTVTFSNGKTFEDTPDGCDLDEALETAKDVGKAADVERPADLDAAAPVESTGSGTGTAES